MDREIGQANPSLGLGKGVADAQGRRGEWPTLVWLGAGIVILVGLGSWFAGEQYDRLNSQQLVSELVDAQRSETALRAELEQRNAQLDGLKKSAGVTGAAGAAEVENLKRQLLRQQASVNDYQTLIDRDRKAVAQNELLLDALAEPNTEFLSLSTGQSDSEAVAYALILPQSRMLLVASRLAPPPAGKEYQIWLMRRDDPKIVSAGIIEPDESQRAVVEFADSELVSAVSAVLVTEEPVGGSKAPAGPKIFLTADKSQ